MHVEVSLANGRIHVGGVEYTLRGGPKWFDLIAYLAYRRWARARNGDATVDEIRTLSSWQRTSKTSVGTVLWRRIREDAERPGGPIMSSPAPSSGPYRLIAEPSAITFDCDPAAVAEYLGVVTPPDWPRSSAERLLEFAEAIGRGDVQFRRGDLDLALASYRRAQEMAEYVDQHVAALAKTARTQQHLGHEAAAADTVAAIRALLANEKHDDVFATLTLLKHEAWVHLRHRRLPEAEAAALQGLHRVVHAGHPYTVLAGDFHNALGQVAKWRGQWAEARSRYGQALLFWSVADYHYGIQAAFFNLGQLERLLGDERAIGRGRGARTPTTTARDAYRRAEMWLTREIAFCAFADVGGNEAADLIELASTYARLGEITRALVLLDEAEERCVRSRNRRDIDGVAIVRGAITRYRASGEFRELLRA